MKKCVKCGYETYNQICPKCFSEVKEVHYADAEIGYTVDGDVEPVRPDPEQCSWLCPICEGRCGGVEGHGGQHQCPDPGHPRASTEAFQVKLQRALDVIGELEAVSGVARVESLFAVLLRRHNVSRADASSIIGVLERDGAIYSPRPGYYKSMGGGV